MKQSRHMDWSWVLILVWMGASVFGVLYSFRFLFSATVIFIVVMLLKPRSRKIDRGYEALRKVWHWEENGGPRPPEDVFRQAADWFMHEWVHDLRQEDMSTWRAEEVPVDVRKYIKSSRELPYRNGRMV